jgi:hypothetical protein
VRGCEGREVCWPCTNAVSVVFDVPADRERGTPQLSFLPTFIVATQWQWPPTSLSQVREIMVFLAVDARPDMSVD